MSSKLKDYLEKFVRPLNDAIGLIDELTVTEQRLGEIQAMMAGEIKTMEDLKASRRRAEQDHEKAMQELDSTLLDLKTKVDAEVVKLNFELAAAQEANRKKLAVMTKKENELSQAITVAENRLMELTSRADEAEKRETKAIEAVERLKAKL